MYILRRVMHKRVLLPRSTGLVRVHRKALKMSLSVILLVVLLVTLVTVTLVTLLVVLISMLLVALMVV